MLEFGLKQHVNRPTHRDGHTLDLIITRTSDCLIITEPIADYFISDHAFVICQLHIPKPSTITKKINYRKYKEIDTSKFEDDIKQSCLYLVTEMTCDDDPSAIDEVVAQYNSTLRKILDDHAPEKSKIITMKPIVPWITEQIKDMKRQKRKAERKWLQHRGDPKKSTTYREEYQTVRNLYRSAIDEAKTGYYSSKVQESAGDQKKLFVPIHSLTKPQQEENFPDSSSIKDLANAFCDENSKDSNQIGQT